MNRTKKMIMRMIMRVIMKLSVNFEILMREDVPVDILFFSLSFFEISFFKEASQNLRDSSFHRYKNRVL